MHVYINNVYVASNLPRHCSQKIIDTKKLTITFIQTTIYEQAFLNFRTLIVIYILTNKARVSRLTWEHLAGNYRSDSWTINFIEVRHLENTARYVNEWSNCKAALRNKVNSMSSSVKIFIYAGFNPRFPFKNCSFPCVIYEHLDWKPSLCQYTKRKNRTYSKAAKKRMCLH